MTKLRENGGYEAEKKERETEKHDEKAVARRREEGVKTVISDCGYNRRVMHGTSRRDRLGG